MNADENVGRTLRRASCALLFALVAACDPGEFLQVTDPDIINPEDVKSAAGANAVRLGALSRLNTATTGTTGTNETLFLLGGLFADEWINGDSFIARQQVDQRVISAANNFLTTANRNLHRARVSAEQAIDLLEQFNPAAPGWHLGEMDFIQAYVMNLSAEHYCDGLVFSTVVDGVEQYGSPITTAEAFQQALELADHGLGLISGTTPDDLRVRNALQVVRGRILLNLDRPADAASAVTAVPTDFSYDMLHSQTTNDNQMWSFNNSAGRYSVGNSEGGNGLNFASAADPRVPVCVGGTTGCASRLDRDDDVTPLHVQMIWPTLETPVAIIDGIEARLIEAEAQLAAGNVTGWLNTLNTARETVTGLAALADPNSETARVDLLFRERAFWLFGRGHRVGDLRRLIRQYGRTVETTFPIGAWHKGGNYGTEVTIPIPQDELNNPNVPQSCLNRNA